MHYSFALILALLLSLYSKASSPNPAPFPICFVNWTFSLSWGSLGGAGVGAAAGVVEEVLFVVDVVVVPVAAVGVVVLVEVAGVPPNNPPPVAFVAGVSTGEGAFAAGVVPGVVPNNPPPDFAAGVVVVSSFALSLSDVAEEGAPKLNPPAAGEGALLFVSLEDVAPKLKPVAGAEVAVDDVLFASLLVVAAGGAPKLNPPAAGAGAFPPPNNPPEGAGALLLQDVDVALPKLNPPPAGAAAAGAGANVNPPPVLDGAGAFPVDDGGAPKLNAMVIVNVLCFVLDGNEKRIRGAGGGAGRDFSPQISRAGMYLPIQAVSVLDILTLYSIF